MFKISQKTEYSIRALVELCLRGADRPVPAREIAASQSIPLRFLEQQIAQLGRAGLVESLRGSGGGCRLSRDPDRITVAHVVDAMEGPLYPMYCLDPDDHTCTQDTMCGLQELWGEVHAAVRQVFERVTIADLAQRHRAIAPSSPIWSPSDLLRPAPRG